MGSRAKNWLLGCGLGCVGVVLIGILLVVGAGFLIKDKFKGFEGAVETRALLDERFGAVGTFTPPPEGAVSAERMEAFLAVREATATERGEIARTLSGMMPTEERIRELDSATFLDKLRFGMGIGKSAFGFGARLGDFFNARNQALLDAGIGMGEYTYIYALAYYSWLGHSPGDGPEDFDVQTGSDHGAAEGEIKLKRRDVADLRLGDSFQPRVRLDLLDVLRNQRAAVAGTAGAGDGWRDALDAEIAAMEADRGRWPWSDGLPPQIAASLEPYGARLEASYDPTSNPFELARNRKRGSFSIQAE